MAKKGYYDGNDYIEYKSGSVSPSVAKKIKEKNSGKTIKCPNCGNVVPLQKVCIICDKIIFPYLK